MEQLSESMIERLEIMMGIHLGDSAREKLMQTGRQVIFSKGSYPIRQGEGLHTLYIILQGIVRGFYIEEDGEEVTKCFSVEGQFFGTEGLRNTQRATFGIECLEDCICLSFPYFVIEEIRAEDKLFLNAVEQLFRMEVTRLERRTKEILMLDAAARYKAFEKEYPDLVNRVKLQYIASYIGIRPESLSRIRKQIKN